MQKIFKEIRNISWSFMWTEEEEPQEKELFQREHDGDF